MKKKHLLTFLAVWAITASLFAGFSTGIKVYAATPSAAAGTEKVKLTIDDAKKIAFDDAGVKEKDVVLKKAGLTTDDGVIKYEVEFYYNDMEYEYDIDPNTGKIMDLDKDSMDAEDQKKMEALQKQANTKPSDKNAELSLDDAKKIAFDDAGVKEKDVVLKRAGTTRDDGIIVYEIEFYYKDVEYEYDIDPKTGIITDLDRDPMDDEDYTKMKALQKQAKAKTSDKNGTLTLDDAKKIAFDDAGAKEKEVVLKKAAKSKDDGMDVYEVDFYYKDVEYEYDIDPNTGIIMDLDRDPMDKEDYAEMKALQQKAEKAATGDTGGINEDKAFEIALTHAKVAASDVYDKKVKLDFDDDLNKEIYEVEFKAGGMEYSYDIDPDTGEILDFEIDEDD